MIRKQVYIEEAQDRRLKRQARALGVTEAELIRRGLDAIRGVSPAFVPDEEAWGEERAFLRRRARLRARGRSRGWRREDLYAERTRRVPG